MEQGFRSRLASAPSGEPVRCIVRYKDSGARSRSLGRAPGSVMVGHQYSLIPAQALLASPEYLLALAQDDEVEQVWEDLPVHTMLDVSVPLVRAPQLWSQGLEGDGIRVAVVDTGIDPDHPDFGGLRGADNPTGRIIAIADFNTVGGDGRDGNGHGTHVASTILGGGEASGGKYVGVAPEAELLVARVLGNDGGGRTSDVMAGVEWAVEQGAHVINLSLGADVPCDGTDAMSTVCEEAVARGVMVCVAAGNAGPGAGTVGSPGCARNVLTVGATTDADQVTGFSSRGPTADGRVKPDVCFPGHNIVAARARGTSMGTPIDPFYTSASGTSMATPHAAGAAALLLQAYPELTPADLKARLMATAKDLGVDANTQGRGRADILAAHDYVPVEPPPVPEPPTEPPPPIPEPPPVTPPPPPGGCLTLGQGSSRAAGDEVRGGISREVWWIIGALVLLCIFVTCAAAVLLAIGLNP